MKKILIISFFSLILGAGWGLYNNAQACKTGADCAKGENCTCLNGTCACTAGGSYTSQAGGQQQGAGAAKVRGVAASNASNRKGVLIITSQGQSYYPVPEGGTVTLLQSGVSPRAGDKDKCGGCGKGEICVCYKYGSGTGTKEDCYCSAGLIKDKD